MDGCGDLSNWVFVGVEGGVFFFLPDICSFKALFIRLKCMK